MRGDRCGSREAPHDLPLKAEHPSLARVAHERDVALLTGLEADGRARRDVEAEAARLVAVEDQRVVGLEEVVVRADLDRSIAAVGDPHGHPLAPLVERDLAVEDQHFAWDHWTPPRSADGGMDGHQL